VIPTLFNRRGVGYPAAMPRALPGPLRTLDPFTLAILGAAVLAALLPPSPSVAAALKPFTAAGVALVFFLHGARLSPSDVVRGLRQPRLHLATALVTYAAFPLVALALSPVLRLVLGPALTDGFIFLSALPSTVQSSVAFVAIAGGHVAAAVAAASLSNLLGVIATPLILSFTLATPAGGGDVPLGAAVAKLGLIILAPFALGQLVGRFLRPFLVARRGLVGLADRAVIAVLVYEAVGQSVTGGVWSSVGAGSIVLVGVAALVLLGVVTAISAGIARALRLPREDAVVLVYCGSKKSMASGLPMLRVLHGDSPAAGTLALPIILFHQLQLMVFSQIATRARRHLTTHPPDSDA
jgi:sodium/bile acid cotransporter 7